MEIIKKNDERLKHMMTYQRHTHKVRSITVLTAFEKKIIILTATYKIQKIPHCQRNVFAVCD